MNISICSETKIALIIPIEITESLDKLNTSSDYYSDICYTATSDSGIDILLKDRKKEFLEGNKTICQDDCDFYEYNYSTKKANCSCNVKKISTSFSNITINTGKLFKNFKDIRNIANIKILVCYRTLLNKEGILYNIGSYIIITIIIFHIICIFIFYIKQNDILKNKIKDIFNILKYLTEIKSKKQKNNTINFHYNKNTEGNNCNNDIIKNKKNNKSNPIKRNKKFKNNNILNKSKNNIIKSIKLKKSSKKRESRPMVEINNPMSFNIIKNKKNLLSNYKRKKRKKFIKPSQIILNNSSNINSTIKNIANISSNQRGNMNLNINSNQKIEKAKNILDYTDDEINDLSYELALQYDKRTYCIYYLSLIKTKHNLIFSFYNNSDYNSKIIKIDIFFVGFVIYYAVNGLFFDDNTMHKIYETKGSFNLEYQLPQIIYSSLISLFINTILRILALSNNEILEFKKNKDKKKLDERKNNLKNNLEIKFILYFILSFIFLIFFWYYISMFGAIYKNTQYHLLKDTLISFGLSLIYPLGIYLLPGIFRIPALSNKNKCLYKFSKILQIF